MITSLRVDTCSWPIGHLDFGTCTADENTHDVYTHGNTSNKHRVMQWMERSVLK